MRAIRAALTLLALGAVVSCGGASTGPSGAGGGTGYGGGQGGGDGGGATSGNVVQVGNNFFDPPNITVTAGTTVIWQWGSGDTGHSVTFDDGTTSSIMSAGSYQRTFTTPGTYNYHRMVHGTAMSGSVTVQ